MTQQMVLDLFVTPLPSVVRADASTWTCAADAAQRLDARPISNTSAIDEDAEPARSQRCAASADPVGTLQDIIDRLQCREDLPPRRRRDLISAVRSVARLLARPPALIVANLAQLRRALAAAGPAAVDMSKKRLANVKADAARALSLVGTAQTRHRRAGSLSAEWQSLASQLHPGLRWSLSRVAGWCSDNGIAPGMVDDSVLDRLIAEVDGSSLVTSPEKLRRQIVRAWANARRTVPSWPTTSLGPPARPRTWGIPWADFFSDATCRH